MTRIQDTFTSPPVLSSRFSSSSSSQYHAALPSLSHFSQYLQTAICRASQARCHTAATSLLSANYLDIDFDAISHAVLVTAFWERAAGETGVWDEVIEQGGAGAGRVEVGVLNPEEAIEPGELSLGGFLTVVGEDDHKSESTSPLPIHMN